jgi:hypothetical protein
LRPAALDGLQSSNSAEKLIELDRLVRELVVAIGSVGIAIASRSRTGAPIDAIDSAGVVRAVTRRRLAYSQTRSLLLQEFADRPARTGLAIRTIGRILPADEEHDGQEPAIRGGSDIEQQGL